MIAYIIGSVLILFGIWIVSVALSFRRVHRQIEEVTHHETT